MSDLVINSKYLTTKYFKLAENLRERSCETVNGKPNIPWSFGFPDRLLDFSFPFLVFRLIIRVIGKFGDFVLNANDKINGITRAVGDVQQLQIFFVNVAGLEHC